MGVGNLNVSCSADMNPAVGSIGKLGGSVRAMAADVRSAGPAFSQLESQINRAGATAAEFEKKFARAKTAPAAPRIGGSDVDLSGMADRYSKLNQEIAKSKNLLGQWKDTLSTGRRAGSLFHKSLDGIAAAVAAVKIGFDVYQKGIKQSWLDWGTSIGNAIGAIDHSLDKANEKRSQKLDQQRAEVDKLRDLNKQFESEHRNLVNVARYGPEGAQYLADRETYGANSTIPKDAENARRGASQAFALMLARSRVAERESAAASAKHKEEERINAMQKQREAWFAAEQKKRAAAMANQKKDEKTVRDLQQEAADFWKTARKRREEETLRNIEDPRLRQQAGYAFAQLRAAEAVKAKSEDREKRRTRPTNDALDARTSQGWAALRKNLDGGPQQKLLESTQRHEKLAETANGYLAKLIDNSIVEVYDIK